MNVKNKGKRRNVALIRTAHNRLVKLSETTGISMTKLVDVAVVNLLKDPAKLLVTQFQIEE